MSLAAEDLNTNNFTLESAMAFLKDERTQNAAKNKIDEFAQLEAGKRLAAASADEMNFTAVTLQNFLKKTAAEKNESLLGNYGGAPSSINSNTQTFASFSFQSPLNSAWQFSVEVAGDATTVTLSIKSESAKYAALDVTFTLDLTGNIFYANFVRSDDSRQITEHVPRSGYKDVVTKYLYRLLATRNITTPIVEPSIHGKSTSQPFRP